MAVVPSTPSGIDKPEKHAHPTTVEPWRDEESSREATVEEDEHANKFTFRRLMAFVAMAFCWTSGQMPPYLYGGIAPIVYGDIGGVDRWVWFITANLIALAAVAPFVGALSDLLGRRYVAMLGSAFIIIGQIVCVTAHEMNPFIGESVTLEQKPFFLLSTYIVSSAAGMALSGVGAGISELISISGLAEIAPTAQRGVYIAALIMTILPWCPSVMWGQLIAANAHWRYVGVMIIAYTAVGLAVAFFFYSPPPRVNSASLSGKETVSRIDFVGGLTSITGIILLIAGILWGGYMYAWKSAHVLAPFIIGLVLILFFVYWEGWVAKYPMVPRRLGKAPRTLVLIMLIAFISGANFFSVLMLWPTQAYNVYGHDPVAVGLRGLPFGFGVMAGCVITLGLMTWLRGRGIRVLLLVASCVMTAGCGAMAAANRDNEKAVYAILLVSGLGKLTPELIKQVSTAMVLGGVKEPEVIKAAIELTSASLTQEILHLPGVDGNVELWQSIVLAGQNAYAMAYPWVYYCSIAFGGVSIVASAFVQDIAQFMDEHVAVVI
ncbi:Major facilitator superfamily domain, general substrate transporter [Metarhizium robertsii ARSEF 23]|uniref:Major facilitator superfamily domain, general substrate transporter n=1 Tax=Metarhizium robertsii (strain ARSEF 23 / ATCC MYA-3075) TaxID=655844 RepID=E9EYE0_METRA|nr:Major facilitator superfamily domain, general substrate transporter [Metarhizium robertsii ARSEF 23]EFY98981.1 Major facilitator superfamily domain, general substrate transporter [Metarhizium robertsii ARSEF 23]